MSVAFRSASNVVNGTAGTSVTVSAPAGMATTDILVAFIAETGTGSITAPAGWTFIGTVASTTTVTLNAYWSTGVGSSWTWTLGASVRNWGWVGAYTGVDRTSPAYIANSNSVTVSGTLFTTNALAGGNLYGMGLCAAAAVRAASGTATTWTSPPATERADLSTNGGTGTDIAGSVSDFAWTALSESATFSASQSQSSGVTWALFLLPAFTAYDPTELLVTKVEAAFGANPDADPSTWTWTDISAYARAPNVTITKGRSDWAGQANATEITLTLGNSDGRFTPGNAYSPHWPNITRNLPIRVSVPVGYAPPTERAVAFVRKWITGFDGTPDNPIVSIVANGRLYRTQRKRTVQRSPVYRAVVGLKTGSTLVSPRAYWPCEDSSGATSAASAIAGVTPMAAANVTFAGISTLGGSRPLPVMSDSASGAAFVGTVPPYAATGLWDGLFVMVMPSMPAGTVYPVAVTTDGTAPLWAIAITPGSPATFGVRAYDSSGTQILAADTNVDTAFFGTWWLFSLGVTQNGSNVDYYVQYLNVAGLASLTRSFNFHAVSGSLASRTCGNAQTIRAAANAWTTGSGVGHFAVYTDPLFDTNASPSSIADALDGHFGEKASSRFARLCQEEGISYGLDAVASETPIGMGVQPVAAVTSMLQECQDVDMGLIHDGGPGGQLYFNTRTARYNQTPALVLNNAFGQVGKDIAPTFDDEQIENDITVSRSGGSSANYTNTSSVTAEGDFANSGTGLNLADDSHLLEIAGWKANLGTTPGMRLPHLPFSLVSSPTLARQWLGCSIGSRVQATNLPGQYGTADVIVEGYTEVLGAYTWDVVLNCSPARPYDVFTVEGSGNSGRLDTAGSTLSGGVAAGAGSLSVATASGPLWVTGAVSFDVEVAGIQVSVTNISGSSSPQTFTVVGSTVTKDLPNSSVVKLWHAPVLAL